jgi:hypothetical protein
MMLLQKFSFIIPAVFIRNPALVGTRDFCIPAGKNDLFDTLSRVSYEKLISIFGRVDSLKLM